MIFVAIAGHFNPLHPGHIALIQEATTLGNHITVIVANDKQAKFKRPKVFMNEKDRMLIMKNLEGVDKVVLSVDNDNSVCKTLELLKPDVFASGCSSNHPDALKEQKTCDRLKIKTVYVVGGKKIRSSSKILKKYASK